jgi:hypothetical protein
VLSNPCDRQLKNQDFTHTVAKIFFFITTLRRVMAPPQHPVQRELEALSPGLNLLEVYHDKDIKSHSGLLCQSFTFYYPSIHEDRLMTNMQASVMYLRNKMRCAVVCVFVTC